MAGRLQRGDQKGKIFMCQACGSADLVHAVQSSRRRFLASAGAALAAVALASPAVAAKAKAPPPKPQNVLPPDAALDRLVKGNGRYVAGLSKRHDFKSEREPLVSGQNPYAGVLSCADSRIAPEYAFDTSRGDLFVVRVAGNFTNADNIA